MAFTFDDWLPTYEEIDVQEIELTAAPLRAGAHHFGKYCDNQCKVHTQFHAGLGNMRLVHPGARVICI